VRCTDGVPHPAPVVVLPRPRRRSRPYSRYAIGWGCPSFRARGHGLSGGATPHRDGVILSLAKFDKILKIDAAACTPSSMRGAQCGHQRGRAPYGLYYAPTEQPDRLHHRRQCREKLRRRPLLEIRPDPAQCFYGVRGFMADGDRWNSVRRRWMPRVSISSPSSSAARACSRDRRSHGEAHAEAAAGPLHHGELR